MGFLAPHNLFWAASIALLVLIYLRSRSQPTLEVSSLLLFEEAPAPVASVRHARLDLLFWIEVAGLAALSLAVSGLYALWPSAGARARTHALVFDLAAGMTAVEHDRPRLSAARDAAQAVIASASPDDEFCVIGYALDANLVLAPTANRDSVNRAIASLRASAVPARDSALRAAMMRAANAAEIELFTDRDPPPAAIGGISSRTAVHVHRIGESADNVAVVSLDPGVPGRVRGRAVLRNFSVHPRLCQFAVDIEGRELYNQSLVFAPREQATISFGPLNDGGLLRARILTPDAIEADNQRWAWAAPGDAQDVLVLSPDAGVRDDLARLLLAINSTLRVEAADAAHFTPAGKRYALAVMHDSYAPGIRAGALLFIYPPLAQNLPPYLKITSTAPSSQMRVGQVTSAPILLDSARVMQFPEWMEPLARASRPHNAESFVAAAYGRAGRIGVLGFDIRDHFLLDPDRMSALVMVTDLIKRISAPADVEIVPTGSFVEAQAAGTATVRAPDGSVETLVGDRAELVRFRALQAGHYTVESAGSKVDVYANYYDAEESDLAPLAKPVAWAKAPAPSAAITKEPRVAEPLTIVLVALALFGFMLESALLVRHASRWGMRHV